MFRGGRLGRGRDAAGACQWCLPTGVRIRSDAVSRSRGSGDNGARGSSATEMSSELPLAPADKQKDVGASEGDDVWESRGRKRIGRGEGEVPV